MVEGVWTIYFGVVVVKISSNQIYMNQSVPLTAHFGHIWARLLQGLAHLSTFGLIYRLMHNIIMMYNVFYVTKWFDMKLCTMFFLVTKWFDMKGGFLFFVWIIWLPKKWVIIFSLWLTDLLPQNSTLCNFYYQHNVIILA